VPPLILVVEDDPTTQGITRRMLQMAGYTVLTADTAIDALQRLKDGPVPDLAVLDMRLPDLPGSKLALRIHAEHPRIPILFVSGWVGEAVNLDQLAALRWEFLQKPFTRESLLPIVERLLGAGI
jgi:two-component system cell cycle sensor histidine kinase/response regulator CckA